MGASDRLASLAGIFPLDEFASSAGVSPSPGGPLYNDRLSSLSGNFGGVFGMPDDEEEELQAKRIIDGDTLETNRGDIVRMIGIDTPESVRPGMIPEPFSKDAAERLRQLIPEGSPITLTPGYEEADVHGRLLAFVENESGNLNKQMIASGLANLTSFDHPKKAEFIDALEQAIIDQLGAFSFQEQLKQQPGIEAIEESNQKYGYPSLYNEAGEPNNPIFMEAFEEDRRKRAFAGLSGKLQEAAQLINELRAKELGEANALTGAGGPEEVPSIDEIARSHGVELGPMSPTRKWRDIRNEMLRAAQEKFDSEETAPAEVDTLEELLPIKAGLQTALGQEVTAPVPQAGNEVSYRINEAGETERVEGETVYGPTTKLSDLAQAAVNLFTTKEGATDKELTKRFTSRLGYSVARFGQGAGEAFGNLVFPTEGLSEDALQVLESMRKVDREKFANLPGWSDNIAEFLGESAPAMLLAAIGPGGIPAARLAGTSTGRLIVRSSVNALENMGLENLAPVDGNEPDYITAAALGAAFGVGFDLVGRAASRFRPQRMAQQTMNELVEQNPELMARVLTGLEDKVQNFDTVWRSLDEDIAQEARRVPVAEFTQEQVWADIAVKDTLREAFEAVDAADIAPRTAQMKTNILRATQKFVDEGDYETAWKIVHHKDMSRHLGKAEASDLKESLLDAVAAQDPQIAHALRNIDMAREWVESPQLAAVLRDLDEGATNLTVVDGFFNRIKDLPEDTQEAMMKASVDPEAGFWVPPWRVAQQRYERLSPAMKHVVDNGLVKDAHVFRTNNVRAWNTVRDNVTRLRKAGYDVDPFWNMLDRARVFEESSQGKAMLDLLDASKDLRPASKALLEGESHYKNLVRRGFNIGQAQKTWTTLSDSLLEPLETIDSVRGWVDFINSQTGAKRELLEKVNRSFVADVEADKFLYLEAELSGNVTGQPVTFTIKDIKETMATLRITTPHADFIDVMSQTAFEKAQDFARTTYNKTMVSQLNKLHKEMRNLGAGANDLKFIENLRGALQDSGSVNAAMSFLRSFMAMSRLPMVAVANLPQLGHTAFRSSIRELVEALWNTHAPSWAGNPHRQRVRRLALLDNSAADTMINEHIEQISSFSKNIPPAIADAAGRPGVGIGVWKRFAGWTQRMSKSAVGDLYGLKPMERWLRTVSSEAGRLHTASLLKTARRLLDTPEGENMLRAAWAISDNVEVGDAFFRNVAANTKGYRQMRTQSLVKDLRDFAPNLGIEDVVNLRNSSIDDIVAKTNRFFDAENAGREFRAATDPVEVAVSRAGRYFTEHTQFRVGLPDLPLAFNAAGFNREFLRTLGQFRTFTYKHWNEVIRKHVILEASRGNMLPAVKFFAVAFPFGSMLGFGVNEIKDLVGGGTSPSGGPIMETAIDYVTGRISGEEFDRELEHMKRPDLVAARSWENFQAWGGIGLPGEVVELYMRGRRSIPGFIAGAGPSSVVSGVMSLGEAASTWHQKGARESIPKFGQAASDLLGNPFGTTRTATRYVNERYDVGRPLESGNPTLIQRLLRSEDQARARAVSRQADITGDEATEIEQRLEDVRREANPPEVEGIPEDFTGRAEERLGGEERSKRRAEIREEYYDAVLNGSRYSMRRIERAAEREGIRLNWKQIRRQLGYER